MLQTNIFKTFFASLLVMTALSFSACSSDDGPEDELPGDEKNIIGKWEVSGSNSNYGSFEFTGDKKYIIEQHVKGKSRAGDKYIIIIFGDYTTLESSANNEFKLDLKEFGVIKIAIDKNGATITVNGETYTTSKAKEVEITDNTKLLCHDWKESHIIEANGERWDNDDPGYRLVFTQSGTYYFQETDEEEPNGFYVDYGTWEWTKDGKLQIMWIDDEEDLIDPNNPNSKPNVTITERKDIVEIIKLTEKEFVFKAAIGTEDEYTQYLYR